MQTLENTVQFKNEKTTQYVPVHAIDLDHIDLHSLVL